MNLVDVKLQLAEQRISEAINLIDGARDAARLADGSDDTYLGDEIAAARNDADNARRHVKTARRFAGRDSAGRRAPQFRRRELAHA